MDEAASCARLNAKKALPRPVHHYAMILSGEEKRSSGAETWISDNWPKDAAEQKRQTVVVSAQDVAQVTAKMTGIPAAQLMKDQNKRLLELEDRLHERVVGQDEAVDADGKGLEGASPVSMTPIGQLVLFCFWDLPALERPNFAEHYQKRSLPERMP